MVKIYAIIYSPGKGDNNFSVSIAEIGQGRQRPEKDQSSEFGAREVSTFDELRQQD